MIKDRYTMEELSEQFNVLPDTMYSWCGHYTLTKFIKHYKNEKPDAERHISLLMTIH